MTREEAKAIIKAIYEEQLKDEFLLSIRDEVMTKIDDAFKVVFELLDNEPCEDCWSKKEVADIINRKRFGINKISMGIIKEKLEALPPVTPTRKKGKWVEVWDKDHIVILAYKCSECGTMRNTKTKYCADCGAEMEGGE